jgi:hypothetical protein
MNNAPVALPTEKPCSVCGHTVDRRRVHRCELEHAPVTHIECETDPTLELPGRADRGFWERVDAARAEIRKRAA